MKLATFQRREAEWRELQEKYRLCPEELHDILSWLSARWRSMADARAYAHTSEKRRWDVVRRKIDRLHQRMSMWLERHSPWDWHSGTSCAWIASRLTAAQALSDVAPLLPAESAAWGHPKVQRLASRAKNDA